MKKIILFIALLIILTSCAKEELIQGEKITSEIKPVPGTELPEPLEPEEIKEEVVVEKEENISEEVKDENIVYIEIKKFEFVPDKLNIPAGTTVIWKNVDDKAHIFRQVGTGFRSPIIKAGETFEYTFNKSEVFKFTEFNYGQRGEIVVY